MSQQTISPHLLIVDDDPDIRLILSDLLECEGYRIDVVGTGADALAHAQETRYQAVILDIGLPDMDGFSVLESLLEQDPDLPVIVLSAHRSDQKTAGSLQKGAFAYLAKPYNNDVLKATLRQAVGIKSLAEEAREARAALVRSEDQFRAVVESAPDAIVLADDEGRVISWNLAAEQLFGYREDEIIRQPLTRLMPSRYRDAHLRGMTRFKASGDSPLLRKTVDLAGLRKDGTEFPIELSLSAWQSPGGRICFSGIIRDVSERKRAEESLRRRLEIEQTLCAMSARFVQTLDFECAVSSALADMGRISGAGRAYVFLFREDGTIMDCTHEWCADGVPPEIDNLQNLSTSDYAWAMHKIASDGLLHVPDVSQLPEEAANEKRTLEAQAIKSLLILPIYANQTLAGYIGFDNVESPQPWRDEDLLLLRLAAEILGNALQRKQVEESLRKLQRQYESILNAAGEGIYGLDEEGRVTFINPAGSQMLGWSEEALLGQRMHTLIHHTRVDGLPYPEEECPIEAASWDGKVHHDDSERFWRKDGTSFPVEFVSTPLMESGVPKGAVVVFKDITHRKWSEGALQESRERLQQLADHIHEVFWLTDPPKEQIFYISQGYEEIWGRSRESLYETPQSWLDAIHPEDRPRIHTSALTRQTSGDYDEVYRIVRPDGSIRWIHDRAFPIRDKTGRVYRIAGIAQDITTLKTTPPQMAHEESGGHASS